MDSENSPVIVEIEVIRLSPMRRRGLVVLGRRRPGAGRLELPVGRLRRGEEAMNAVARVLLERVGVLGPELTPAYVGFRQYPERQDDAATLTLSFAVLGARANTSDTSIDFVDVDPVATLHQRIEHPETIMQARRTACDLIETTPIALALLPNPESAFSLNDLLSIYRHVEGPEVRIDPSNFRRKIEVIPGFVRPVLNANRHTMRSREEMADAQKVQPQHRVNPAPRARSSVGRPPTLYVAGNATALTPPIRFRQRLGPDT